MRTEPGRALEGQAQEGEALKWEGVGNLEGPGMGASAMSPGYAVGFPPGSAGGGRV